MILNWLCDSLVSLALVYSSNYPDEPFCLWLLGTEFVEHFFGLAHMLLPNFSFVELLKVVQNIMVCQCIMLSGQFKEQREKESAAGYIFDFDTSALNPEETRSARANLT